ncbi:type I pullulanase [Parabacteroides sp. PF5-6]|uniref:type I pullulanase n=1 Tax=Parabacteroides sp. PF5-6 TaxID=1742403 RepID=UPI0024050A8C|nr:type I pullulanase [Parabacteroides sp. PF5-6]MDF9828778.1 pullulanase [Parabacteroides sp. PF5-6]
MKSKSAIFVLLSLVCLSGCWQSGYQSYDDYPLYEGTDLELTYTPQQADFTLWSPAARKVRLNLYTAATGGEPAEVIAMRRAEKGTWRTSVARDLVGWYYTFQVCDAEGQWLAETPGIWAKAVGVNGDRAAIIHWQETDPEGWDEDQSPELKNFTDIVLYEMHHRDFSVSPTSGMQHKGKFLALAETGTKTPEGLSSGIDHLKELGVTHVHILPSYDYASVDETRLEDNTYNWGYDPKNYNVPEGSYATDPYDPAVRIREFKAMVKSLHANGLRVVLDVVYNHTYSSDHSNFNLTAPGYFYRHNADGTYANASACGNETASERAMMRRYIVESVKYWVNEYHIDGFRFDLMGIHDLETMNRVRSELSAIDPTIFIYGEGWTAGDSPLPVEKRAIKVNAPGLNQVAVFSDDLRDALKGSVFEEKQAGFASGRVEGNAESVKFGIVGATQHPQVNYHKVLYSDAPYANNPTQVINYVSCHDDLCLVDKLQLSAPEDATPAERIKFNKLAQTIVFTSQGVPFMRAGEELHHTKQGVHNSYKSPDAINQIDWSDKTKYAELYTYYQNLIALRRDHPAFRIPTTKGVMEHLRFIETYDPGVVAYTLGEYANGDAWREILVVFNGNRHAVNFPVPDGEWTVVCRNGRIDPNGLGQLRGGRTRINASSALIVYRE